MIVGFDNYKHLYNFDVKGIIHVGAHIGQEHNEYKSTFGDSIKTHWFEPLPDTYNTLVDNLKHDDLAKTYNLALGEYVGTSTIYIDTENGGQSSSILKPAKHKDIFTHINFEKTIEVEVAKLDDFNISDCNMLVLDVQGNEHNVLKGAKNTLNNIDYLFTEFNTVEMYEDNPSLDDLDKILTPLGFERTQTWYTDSFWGDAFYIRKKEQIDYSQNGEQSIILKHFENDQQKTCRFLDIGANDGISFSNTYALSQLGWKGICVEPIPEAFLKLQKLHSENERIYCINVGVSDETKIVSFHQSNDWIGAEAPVGILSTLNESSKNRFHGMNWTETKAIVFNFNEMEKIYKLVDMRYDFINVDVEGHELIVLKQIKEKLKYCKLICIEKSGNEEMDNEVLNELVENGFVLTDTTTDNFIAKNTRFR